MKNKFVILILFILGLVGCYRLLRPGYFSMQDDMQIFRLEQFDKCVRDGQIPCRYVPDAGFGYGYPLFNFYSPLPYAVAEGLHLVGFSYINSIKFIFIITSFIRPLGIFLLSSLFFGPYGGLLSAIIFSLAPYQAVNSYVRGDLAENLALALVPFIFWALKSNKFRLFSVFLALLALTHNLTLLYVIPLLIIFAAFHSRKNLRQFFLYSLLAVGLSAFFIFPAFFEKQFTTVNTMTQGYFYYVNHFATFKQLFLAHNDWGYGASQWGPVDGMSFQIGYLEWGIPLLFVLYLFRKKIKNKSFIFTFFILGLFFAFLAHNKSTFIWTHLPLMAFYQFPWRFVGPAVFCFALISGGVMQIKQISKKPYLSISLILIASLLLNFSFFKEDIWFPSLTDQQKLSPSNIIAQSGAGLKDYWPIFGKNFPTVFAPSTPTVLSGTVRTTSFSKNSLGAKGNFSILSDSAIISLPEVYFPDFELTVDSQPSSYLIDHDLGLITLALPAGDHSFSLKFSNTPIRYAANTASVASLVILGLLYIYRDKKS